MRVSLWYWCRRRRSKIQRQIEEEAEQQNRQRVRDLAGEVLEFAPDRTSPTTHHHLNPNADNGWTPCTRKFPQTRSTQMAKEAKLSDYCLIDHFGLPPEAVEEMPELLIAYLLRLYT